MSHQPYKADREAFLLPKGCGDLADAIQLKRRQAEHRAQSRRLSRTRVSDAFARWSSWAERYVSAASPDVRDPELSRFLERAALLTSREKDQLEKLISEHPLGAKTHQQLMKNLLASCL
jgi:hypothetical protein